MQASGQLECAATYDRVYELDKDGNLYALDVNTGKLVWKLPIEAHRPREPVAIAYGNLYLIPG